MKQYTPEEKKQRRIVEWDETEFNLQTQQFSKRIQKDINTLPFPKIDTIQSSFVSGKIGSGKTLYAVFMMLTYLKNNFIHADWGKTAEFISIPDFLLKLKMCFNFNLKNDKEEKNLSEFEIISKYKNLDFLVFDDFGAEKTTEWALQTLYLIINHRYENEKITIFTSNFTLSELAEKLGDERITSRIQQMCRIVKTNDINYREV
jgi:DNA replication protein DnaC